MNKNKELANNVLHLLAGQGAAKLITIGVTVAFAHLLTKIEFSAVAVLAILGPIISTVAGLGLEATCLREVPALRSTGKITEAAAMVRAAALSRIVLSLLLVILIWLFSEEIASWFYADDEHGGLIRILAVGALFISLITGLELVAQAVGVFKRTAYVEAANAVAYSLGGVLGYWLAGVQGWVLGLVFSRLVGLTVLVVMLREWLLRRTEAIHWWPLVRRSGPFYLRAYMLYGRNQLDQTIVGIFLSAVTLADYYVARSLLSYIVLATESIGRPLMTNIAEIRDRSPKEVGHRLNVISRYQCFAFVPLGLVMLALGMPILELYGGEKYTSAYPMLVILTLATMVTVLWGTVYTRGIFVLGKPWEIVRIDAAGAIATTSLSLALISWLGAIGAAASVLLGAIVTATYSAYLLRRHARTSLDHDALVTSLIAGAAATLASLSFQHFFVSLWLLPVYGGIWGIAYLLVLAQRLQPKDYLLLERTLGARSRRWMEGLRFVGA